MSKLLAVGALCLLTGCASTHKTIHPDKSDLDYLRIIPGQMDYHYKDGRVEEIKFPKESPVDIKDGKPKTYNSGLGGSMELGWDLFGLKLRPMVMCRVAYLFDFGLAVGADEHAFIWGPDFRYKDIIAGPLMGIPWLNPSATIWGGKIGIPFDIR